MVRLLTVVTLLAFPGLAADWSPRLAADYLDSRQKDWFAWPSANKSGAPCMSCHTGMTYMLVRPMLRQALGEKQATDYEAGFTRAMRARVHREPPADSAALAGFGVDTVLNAFLLANEDRTMRSAETRQAFDRLWAEQMPDGGWPWYSLDLDPWEMPESQFYGASIAALAVGETPAAYREQPEVRRHVAMLAKFLAHDEAQPLHNRVMLLWASSRLPEVLPAARRTAIADQLKQAQQPDGGWTLAALGPWKSHEQAPASSGTSAYATALTSFALEQAGVSSSTKMLSSALAWLRSNQSPRGYWDAVSMNKKYPAGSMMELFMRDAATGFASMALLNAGEIQPDRSTRP